MHKILLVIISTFMLTSCVSLVPKKELNMWAISNGYILAENCPTVAIPERQPLPHPEVPTIQIKDSSGNYIPITEAFLMKTIITLFGTIEKFQYLVEIYEREYLNSGGKILPDMSLEDLKKIYLERIKALGGVASTYPSTASSSSSSSSSSIPNINVAELILLIEAFNSFQETGEQ